MASERDTHFAGFAKLLYEEVASTNPLDFSGERTQAIIAQRAYDLAVHTLRSTAYGLDLFDIPSQVNENVPDMTQWPESKKGV